MILPDTDKKTNEYLEMIASETKTATKIISDLLDFARLKSSDRKAVDISGPVAAVLVKHPPPANVEVRSQISADLPTAFIDPAQIEQVLTNLILNAYQAMPNGGRLIVSGEQCLASNKQHSDELTTENRILNTRNCILIAVSDTGSGIPPKYMSKLFEPLFTTKARGIGLGLAISKMLVESNGGSIDVKSSVGHGTTFTLTLPTVADV